MKKILAMFLFISILTLTLSNTFAQTIVSLKDIKYVKNGSQDKISLYSANYKGFKAFYLSNPDRLVVDIPNNIVAVKGSGIIKVNSSMIKSIRYSQFTKTTSRVVFDLKSKQQYTVEQKSGFLTFVFGKPSTSGVKTPVTDRGDSGRPPVTVKDDTVKPPVVSQLSYVSADNEDKLIVSGGNHDGYSTKRLTNPDRIVVDIPNCAVPQGQNEIPGNMSLVKNISYTQLNANTARIVAETNGQPEYMISKEQDQLALIVENPSYRNVIYSVQDGAASLILKGVRLEEIVSGKSTDGAVDDTAAEAASFMPLYSEFTDTAGKKYSITFPTSLADLGSGILQINDDMLNSIKISKDTEIRDTRISFNSSNSHIYDVVYNPETNDTVIHILKPTTKTDKLVVIDPGHGGSDPGATYAGINEKDLNLKIALKVDEVLKSKGVKTYLTRDDDAFVPLYDRANMANDLNAELFLSIHNNAFNKSENGTETLCFPSSTSRQFAAIVQKNLINALGTTNQGIVDRPNLVVLHATKMPSALAEIAYITNDGDRKKLMDEQFLEKAAEALADSVLEALNAMK